MTRKTAKARRQEAASSRPVDRFVPAAASNALDNSCRPSPSVSIGLPVYNGDRYLEEAIQSLLVQTYDDFELILSDNGSTDRTEQICREYVDRDCRVRYIRHAKNRGAAWNFNHAFTVARGRYFKWAADDDAYEPRFLQLCVDALDRDPSAVLAFCRAKFIDEQGTPLDAAPRRLPVDSPDVAERFLKLVGAEHLITEIFGVIRRDVLAATSLIGPYVGSDRVLLGQLALHGRFARIAEPLFLHREHQQRSTYACPNASSQAAWFDPSRGNRAVFWRWRHLGENLCSVQSAPLSFRTKLSLWIRLAWQALRKGDKLARELAVGLALGRRAREDRPGDRRHWWRRPGMIALLSVCRCYAGLRHARERLLPRNR